MNKRYFICTVVTIGLVFYLIYLAGQIKITVDFKELEPFRHSLPVYYKGFRLGHTTKVYPGPNYQSTRVDMKIRLKGLELPENTSAMIRRKDKKDYIELEYPNAPYIAPLRNNTVIIGSKGLNFESYIQDQAKNGGLDEIKENVNTTIVSAGQTFDALTEMIKILTGILEDVRPTIKDSVENLNIASKNLADSSQNVRTTLQQGYVDKSLHNLERTTENLVQTTKNLTGVTDNVNTKSINLINCVISNINTVVGNINQIVVGVGETLKKRFAGIRLFFGKIIQ